MWHPVITGLLAAVTFVGTRLGVFGENTIIVDDRNLKNHVLKQGHESKFQHTNYCLFETVCVGEWDQYPIGVDYGSPGYDHMWYTSVRPVRIVYLKD
jgi:hypothetical protein